MNVIVQNNGRDLIFTNSRTGEEVQRIRMRTALAAQRKVESFVDVDSVPGDRVFPEGHPWEECVRTLTENENFDLNNHKDYVFMTHSYLFVDEQWYRVYTLPNVDSILSEFSSVESYNFVCEENGMRTYRLKSFYKIYDKNGNQVRPVFRLALEAE